MADFRAVPATDDRFVWLHGELDAGSAEEFVATLSPATRSGGAVVVDLSGLSFIDSDGIRALLSVATRMGDRGCLILHDPTPHIAKVFDIVGLAAIPNLHLLDAHGGRAATEDGPGAWSRTAALHHLLFETGDRLARAETIQRRCDELRARTAELLVTNHANRRRGRAPAAVP